MFNLRVIFYLTVAWIISLRSSCNRKKVGAILQVGNMLSIGYNKKTKCTKCESNKGCTSIHAEVMALSPEILDWLDHLEGSKNFVPITLFLTLSPCMDCMKYYSNKASPTCVFFIERHHSFEEVKKSYPGTVFFQVKAYTIISTFLKVLAKYLYLRIKRKLKKLVNGWK